MTKAEWRRARTDAPYQHDAPVVGRAVLCTPYGLIRHFVIRHF
jgi:hypothetical protein